VPIQNSKLKSGLATIKKQDLKRNDLLGKKTDRSESRLLRDRLPAHQRLPPERDANSRPTFLSPVRRRRRRTLKLDATISYQEFPFREHPRWRQPSGRRRRPRRRRCRAARRSSGVSSATISEMRRLFVWQLRPVLKASVWSSAQPFSVPVDTIRLG